MMMFFNIKLVKIYEIWLKTNLNCGLKRKWRRSFYLILKMSPSWAELPTPRRNTRRGETSSSEALTRNRKSQSPCPRRHTRRRRPLHLPAAPSVSPSLHSSGSHWWVSPPPSPFSSFSSSVVLVLSSHSLEGRPWLIAVKLKANGRCQLIWV